MTFTRKKLLRSLRFPAFMPMRRPLRRDRRGLPIVPPHRRPGRRMQILSGAGTVLQDDDGKIILDEMGNVILSTGDSDCECCGPEIFRCGSCCISELSTAKISWAFDIPSSKPSGWSDNSWIVLQAFATGTDVVCTFAGSFGGILYWYADLGTVTAPDGGGCHVGFAVYCEGEISLSVMVGLNCGTGEFFLNFSTSGGCTGSEPGYNVFAGGGTGGVLPVDIVGTADCCGVDGTTETTSANCANNSMITYTGTASVAIENNVVCWDGEKCIAGDPTGCDDGDCA